MANLSRKLYVGVTNNLHRRVFEHKCGNGSDFTSRYMIDRLVYFETFQYVTNAIAREKTIKGWLRERKLQLVEEQNLGWLDLAEGWFSAEELDAGRRGDA
jgi:putative endonuclease